MSEIRDALAKVKAAKSFATDYISSYFLKLALPFIENSLSVTPIFKEGDKSDQQNYRPISVLPVILRLFEKLITDQLYHYKNENGHFSPVKTS